MTSRTIRRMLRINPIGFCCCFPPPFISTFHHCRLCYRGDVLGFELDLCFYCFLYTFLLYAQPSHRIGCTLCDSFDMRFYECKMTAYFELLTYLNLSQNDDVVALWLEWLSSCLGPITHEWWPIDLCICHAIEFDEARAYLWATLKNWPEYCQR